MESGDEDYTRVMEVGDAEHDVRAARSEGRGVYFSFFGGHRRRDAFQLAICFILVMD